MRDPMLVEPNFLFVLNPKQAHPNVVPDHCLPLLFTHTIFGSHRDFLVFLWNLHFNGFSMTHRTHSYDDYQNKLHF
jgi:hypothetical protein